MELGFDALVKALPRRTRALSLGQRLKIPVVPKPFVAPTLTLTQGETAKPLDAEVIFIKASAAVGKSTIASHLSSLLGIAQRRERGALLLVGADDLRNAVELPVLELGALLAAASDELRGHAHHQHRRKQHGRLQHGSRPRWSSAITTREPPLGSPLGRRCAHMRHPRA